MRKVIFVCLATVLMLFVTACTGDTELQNGQGAQGGNIINENGGSDLDFEIDVTDTANSNEPGFFVGRGIFANIAPTLAVGLALDNFVAELAQRLESTPFAAVPMLVESLSYGTTAIGFSSQERWESAGEAWHIEGLAFDVRLVSSVDAARLLLDGVVNIDGEDIDFDIFADEARIKLGSSLLGENRIGVYFDTFEQDFEAFLELIGFTPEDLAMLMELMFDADIAAAFGGAAVFSPFGAGQPRQNAAAYIALLADFIGSADISTELVDLNGTQVQRVEYVFTVDEIAGFLRDLLDMTNLANIAEMNEMMNEVTGVLEELEDVGGDINTALVFYVCAAHRLARTELAVTSDDESEMDMRLAFDFGESVNDPWRMEIYLSLWGHAESSFATWNMYQVGTVYTHYVVFTEEIGAGVDDDNPYVFSLSWCTASGEMSAATDGVVTGIGRLILDNDTFRFTLEHELGGRAGHFSLETHSGAYFPENEYIALGDITPEILEEIIGGLFDLW